VFSPVFVDNALGYAVVKPCGHCVSDSAPFSQNHLPYGLFQGAFSKESETVIE